MSDHQADSSVPSEVPNKRARLAEEPQQEEQEEEEEGLETSLSSSASRGPLVFDRCGVFLIKGALSGEKLSLCQEKGAEFFAEVTRLFLLKQALGGGDDRQFKEITCRDGGRYDVRYRMDEEPFKSLSTEGSWMDSVRAILGQDAELLFCGQVVATGGGPTGGSDQSWHTDGGHLFDTTEAAPLPKGEAPLHTPCHCLNVFVPLVDITEANGCTQFVLNTHRRPPVGEDQELNAAALLCPAGTAILFDYRLLHRGSANETQEDRPILYFTYAKPWFQDRKNHRSTLSLLPGSSHRQPQA